MEISFADFSAMLKAQGLDLEALLGALFSVASAEDLQALQALTQQQAVRRSIGQFLPYRTRR